jgi:tetratricopeptide (TPR) repeat protein
VRARASSHIITLAWASLAAFNVFHLYHGFHSFVRHGSFLLTDPMHAEELVASIYNMHPALICAARIDEQCVQYQLVDKQEKVTNCFERTLALREKVYGLSSPAICHTIIQLGCSNLRDKNYSAAEAAFKRALKICQIHNLICHDSGFPSVVECLDSLAYVYEAQSRYDDAESCEKRAIALTMAKRGNDLSCGNQFLRLAALAKKQAKYQSAIAYYQKNLSIHEPAFGRNDQDSIFMREQIAECQVLSRQSHQI